MIGEPRLEDRTEKPYLGIRVQVPMRELPQVIPQLIGEVMGYLGSQGIAPAGAPFIRYHLINMAGKMDIEVGWPVALPAQGNGRITPNVLPSGRYATLIYVGNYPGLVDATASLLAWGSEKGLAWDSRVTESGDAFGGRFESYWTNPVDEPDLNKHETEIAIRLTDK